MDRWEELENPAGYNTDLMSYYTLEDLRPQEETSDRVTMHHDAEVGYRPDGTRVYVKDVDSWRDDVVQSHIAADIFGNHSPTISPEIAYDDVYGKILVEEVPGEHQNEFSEKQKGPFHRATAEKMLMGESDYAGNFLATENNVIPIDYDTMGRDMITSKMAIKTGMADRIDEDLLHSEASQLADQIDIRALEEDMRGERYLMEVWDCRAEMNDPEGWEGLFIGSVDNILNNVKAFRQ